MTPEFRAHVAKKLGHLLDRYFFGHLAEIISFLSDILLFILRVTDDHLCLIICKEILITCSLMISFISEIPAETPSCAGSAKCDGGDDEGKVLFLIILALATGFSARYAMSVIASGNDGMALGFLFLTGFRLFRTSIPGHQVDDTPPPVRRRPIPSSR